MATHDYVIANQSGAAFRTDLNNALAAIVSNNSNSSEPATKYAYQWWADTSNGVMKLRNSANDGWIELFQLDGTLTLEDGSASTPALSFRDDLNTGVYSSAADTFNVATGGVERMELGTTTIFNESGADVDFRIEGDTDPNLFYVDAGQERIGIGTSTPTTQLHIHDTSTSCSLSITAGSSSSSAVNLGDADDINIGRVLYEHSNNSMQFQANNAERMRIDNLGNVLVGAASSIEVASSAEAQMQITQASDGSRLGLALISIFNGSGPAAVLALGHGRGSTSGVLADNDLLGQIRFAGGDGTDCQTIGADIRVEINGTPASNSMPSDLIFYTNGGASAVTERMRITKDGFVGINNDAPTQMLVINGNMSLMNGGSSGGSEMVRIFNDNGVERIHATNNPSGLAFGIGGTGSGNESFRIDASGNLLKNTTSTIATGSNSDTGIQLGANNQATFMATGGPAVLIARNGSTGEAVRFGNQGNGDVGSIDVTTSSTSYNISSDYRLKENVVAISDGIIRLKTLKPSRFNFKVDKDKTVDGFLAHEVTAVPEAISGTKDEVATEDNELAGVKKGDPIYQKIDLSKLVPLLTAALQESISKIEVLETKVAALEAV